MNISGYSTETLKLFHEQIKKCLDADDSNPSLEKKYEVRSFADWKIRKNAIEAELTKRSISFIAITF